MLWTFEEMKLKLKLESKNLSKPLLRSVSHFFRPAPVSWEFQVELVTGGGWGCRLGWSGFLLDVARARLQLQETPAFVSCVAQPFLYRYIFGWIPHLGFFSMRFQSRFRKKIAHRSFHFWAQVAHFDLRVPWLVLLQRNLFLVRLVCGAKQSVNPLLEIMGSLT